MRPETRDLLAEIDAYCAEVSIAPSTLTTRALNDGKTYDRLSNGGRCWPETAAKIRAYMAAHPPSPDERQKPAGTPASEHRLERLAS